jgi:hypothetical protein
LDNEVLKSRRLDYSALENLYTATVSRTTTKYTEDDIDTYIASPSRYHAKLREVSDYFYNTNGIYKNVITAFANLPTLDYMVIPSTSTLGKMQDKAYSNYYAKVSDYVDSINMKMTVRRILTNVARYGAFVGYERSNGKEFFIQTLPLDYCRIKYLVGNDFQIEFNFKYFDKFFNQEDLDTAWAVYPPEFKKLYNRYKGDAKSRNPEWQMIDINKTVVILANADEPFFIPAFSTMFQEIVKEESYKDLYLLDKTLSTSKLLVQKIPVDKDGNIPVPNEQVKLAHKAMINVLPEGVNGLTTAFDITDVSFRNQNQEKEDLLSKAERGVFVSSGYSSNIFAESGNIGLNINIEVITANIYSVLEKIEDCFNRKFTHIVNSKNYEFKLQFFRTTNINIEQAFERHFKLLNLGGLITPLISLSGMTIESYTTLLQIEQVLGIKSMLQPVLNSNQLGGQIGDTKAGRPETPDTQKTDKGIDTKDKENNDPMARN